MKKAPNLRLSLRKTLIAALAVGPLAVLPAPLWAVLPTAGTYSPGNTPAGGSFTVTNGTVTVSNTGTVLSSLNATDKSVLVWGTSANAALTGATGETVTNFNIQTGETYDFVNSGTVLNRVRAGNTVAATNATYAGVAAYIGDGATLRSSGKVYILSDSGNIVLADGARVNTTNGLVLSTLAENGDGNFLTVGDLAYTGAPTGTINVGNATISGNLSVVSGSIAQVAPNTVSGDLIVRSVTAAQGVSLGAAAPRKMAVAGNLSVTTNNGTISQLGPVLVGSSEANTASFSSGTGAVQLTDAGNDFRTVTVQTSGTSDVAIADQNIVTLGASTIGRDLSVTAGGQINTVAISTSGTVAVGGNATFTSTATNNSGVNIANNSTIGGTVNASTYGGAITINTAGNLTVGNLQQNVTSARGSLATVGEVTVGLSSIPVATGGAGYTVNPTITISAPTVAGGVQATAEPVVVGGVVTGITITNAGSGYDTVPTVTITGGTSTTPATAGAPLVTVLTANVTAASGNPAGVYAAAPGISFTDVDDPFVRATGNIATLYNSTTGAVPTGVITIANGGSYDAVPTVTIANPNTSGAISVTTSGALNIAGTVLAGNNSSTPAVTFNGASTSFATTGVVTGTGVVNINSTAGDVTLGTVTANRISSRAVGGNISQLSGTILRTTTNNSSTASVFNAGSGNITLDGLNNFAATRPIQLTGNTVVLRSINHITLGTTNTTGNLTVTAQGAAAGDRNVTLGTGTGAGAGQNITVGGVLSVTANSAGTITDNDYSNLNIFGGLNLVSTSGAITLDAATANGALAPDVQFGQVNASTTGAVTIAETTTLNLGNITAGSLVATSVTGGIIDSGNITVTGPTGATFTAASSSSVVLDGANNSFSTLNFGGGLDNSVTNLNSDISISGTTLGTGNITIGTNAGRMITLGTANITGNLSLVSGGGIDISGHAIINGNLSLTSTGTLAPRVTANTDGNTITAITANSTALLGTLTFASAPTVTVAAPAAGTTAVGAATFDATTGAVTGFTVPTAGTGYTTAPVVTVGASQTSITESAGTLQVSGTTNITATGDVNLFRGNDFNNVVLNGNGASGDRNAIINDVNDLSISGVALGTVTATAGGAIPAGQAANGPARIANAWKLTLGDLHVGGLVATAASAGGGNSGTLTQASGTRIHSEALSRFVTSNASITINNTGNNFGRVEVDSNSGSNSTSVAIREDGTMKLGVLDHRGSATLTSRFGSIIEDSAADVTVTNNGTLTLNSPTGSISIGNTTHTAGATTGNVVTVVASAPNGSVAVQSSGNLTLGNITALALTASSGNNILQGNNTRASIFGSTNLTATNNITVANSGNNFGRVSLVSNAAGADISITESSTLNIGSVSMGARGNATTNAVAGAGNFTATSENGDIIDSGLGGAKFGGLIAPTGSLNAGALLSGSGTVSLLAANGNIVIDDPTTDFHTITGVVFNGRNVTLSPLGGTTNNAVNLVLGAPNTVSTAGNLTVTTALGGITNNGNLTVTDAAVFQTGNADITLNQSGNRFGTVRFTGRNVRITQANDINLVPGSQASGTADFESGSYITITEGAGIVTLGSTGNFTAVGTIILPDRLQAAGTLTVFSPALKDLSALSISQDLSGRTPVDRGGGGEYRAPQP